ncbi:zinc finger protein 660-like [Tribolium madens]|uniref:zinc finger protein 660-like n=1 Tax=Tribolium madens TaxID=41895 RepID=UPI001CF72A24|nr:zinc finger protein 660-like [Tribolium madens]
MEAVIREGALRLLTSETSCDVILSCQGHRLMAHKLILSIASPLLHDLLLQDTTEPSVLIFPDINSNTMSQILDYIYTGSVIIYSNTINDFIAAANLLKLHIDVEFLEKTNTFKEYKLFEKKEEDVYSKRNQRKLPSLVPISNFAPNRGKERKLVSCVMPSPWMPREMPVLSDPRTCLSGPERSSVHQKRNRVEESDPNNNNSQHKKNNTNNALSSNSNSSTELDLSTSLNQLVFEQKLIPQLNDSLAVENDKCVNTKNRTLCTRKEEETEEKNTCHEKQKPFKCEDCKKTFSQLRNYKYHRSVHEGTKEFAAKCPECGKNFNDRGYLSSHMKIHRDRKEYACPHCPKRFNQRVAYNMHLRIHTGIKPHECPTCGKSFSRKMLLKQHQRVHTGERPYSCPECGKTFADRSNMSLHARLHTGVKPYSCNLCSKSFTKKHHLKTHMNFHTGLKPYTCQKCGLAFSQSSNMRTHYKKCVLKSNGGPSSADADSN